MQGPYDEARAARAAAGRYTDWLLRFPNVTGCGVGHRTAGGRETGEWVLVVFVTRKLPVSALRAEEVVPRELTADEGSTLTDVVEVAPPRLLVDPAQYRPLVGGSQIRVGGMGQGTLGAILYDATDYQPVLLTCNHVVTAPGRRDQRPGDTRIFQPASAIKPIGRTKRIVPWLPALFGAGHNWEARVDAGIIKPDFTVDVAFEVVELGRHPYAILPPSRGLEVVKRGSVTEKTEGAVWYIDVAINLPDFNGQRIRIGGVGSGFAIKRVGGIFASPGDSGSLIVDKDLRAACGLLFGGDMTPGGFTYACELGAILEELQLEMPGTGSLHSMIQRAVRRRIAGASLQVEGHAPSYLGDMVGKMDRFQGKYLPKAPDGRMAGALGATFQALATDLAEAINEDEDFAGLLDEAFGDWLILPTIYDMLEYRVPDDFGQRVLKAFDHLKRRRPQVEGPTRWMQPAFSGCGGTKMRELLDGRVSMAPEKREGTPGKKKTKRATAR